MIESQFNKRRKERKKPIKKLALWKDIVANIFNFIYLLVICCGILFVVQQISFSNELLRICFWITFFLMIIRVLDLTFIYKLVIVILE